MTLAGRRIALTRPSGHNDVWAHAIENAGGEAVHYPLLRLESLEAPVPAQAREACGFVFISPAAVAFAWPALQAAGLPRPDQQLAAVGAGTAAALRERGTGPVLHPPGVGDSNSLLALLGRLDGQCWLLVRGEGGRDVLPQGMLQRGAHLCDWPTYRRSADLASLQGLLRDLDTLDALLLSSSESVRTLFTHAGESQRQRLQSKPLLVLHPRIAAAAADWGATRIALCEGAAEFPATLTRMLE